MNEAEPVALSQSNYEPEKLVKKPSFQLSESQLDRVSAFLLDLAKILIASVVVAFFIPQASGQAISAPTFIVGSLIVLLCFVFGLKFVPSSGN